MNDYTWREPRPAYPYAGPDRGFSTLMLAESSYAECSKKDPEHELSEHHGLAAISRWKCSIISLKIDSLLDG